MESGRNNRLCFSRFQKERKSSIFLKIFVQGNLDISSRTEKTKLMKALYEELEKAMNHDKKMIIKGRNTKFRRTNKQSEEVAKKYTIMRRLQLKLENLTSTRRVFFHDTCTDLTADFLASQSSCPNNCPQTSPYRLIDGCCNNLQRPQLGKKF